jgi:hypothetical protein
VAQLYVENVIDSAGEFSEDEFAELMKSDAAPKTIKDPVVRWRRWLCLWVQRRYLGCWFELSIQHMCSMDLAMHQERDWVRGWLDETYRICQCE